MATSVSNLMTGVAFAIAATLAWSLNFIAPYVTGAYSLYDLTAVRFLFAGVLGGAYLLLYRRQRRQLRLSQQWLAATLGAIGYLGYGSCIAAGVAWGGPVLTPALIGTVPVLLAVIGNIQERQMPWRKLVTPLALIAAGLWLVNLALWAQPVASSRSITMAIFFSLSAIALWIAFSVLNKRAMAGITDCTTAVWTGLMMTGAGVATLGLIPVIYWLGLFKLPVLGFSLDVALRLYSWALVIAVTSSITGAWAWNAATRRLPVALSGQLIALESLFATGLALIFSGRPPTVAEMAGLLVVLLGTSLGIHAALGAKRDR